VEVGYEDGREGGVVEMRQRSMNSSKEKKWKLGMKMEEKAELWR